MALTRKFLSALGIEADKVDEIITAHSETVDALKSQINEYKADAEKLPGVQKELDDLKAANSTDEGYREKYEKEHSDFEAYKTAQTAKETKAKKSEAYRALLKEAGISEKRIDSVLKVSDLESVELDSKGAIKGADKLTESIKTEWADFIETKGKQGADTSTPPGNNHGSTFVDMSLADKMKFANEHPGDPQVTDWLKK